MEENVKWLLGFMITVIIAAAGYARHVSNMIKVGDDALHHRINQTRDEYVRRVDLDAHLSRQDRQFVELKQEFRDFAKDMKQGQDHTNARLDAVLTKLTDRNG